jgi:hypothetical protein
MYLAYYSKNAKNFKTLVAEIIGSNNVGSMYQWAHGQRQEYG